MSKKIIYLILYSVLLLVPAIYNGYPLVFSDTGTYIRSGFEFSIPADRPVFYGLFLRYSSLGLSFWLSIFIQAVLSALALWKLIEVLSPQLKNQKILSVIIFGSCLLFSGLPYYSSVLLSDFAIAPLLVFLFLFYHEKSKINSLLYAICFVLLNLFHLSLLFTVTLLFLTMWVLYFIKILKLQIQKIKQLTLLLLASFILLIGTNYKLGKKAQITPSGHLFLLAKFIDNGLVKKVLKEDCPKENWNICKYKDSLPEFGSDFLWSENSILYKLGGWDSNSIEYKSINSRIILPGKYSYDLIKNGLKSMKKQLLSNYFGAEIFNLYDKKSPPGNAINQFMNKELDVYLNSKQNQSKIQRSIIFQWSNASEYFYYIMLFACFIQLLFYKRNKILSEFILLIISYLIIQSLFIGLFSIEDARYNSRLLWLFIPAGLLSFEGILSLIKK
jgi:hypothetical protein